MTEKSVLTAAAPLFAANLSPRSEDCFNSGLTVGNTNAYPSGWPSSATRDVCVKQRRLHVLPYASSSLRDIALSVIDKGLRSDTE